MKKQERPDCKWYRAGKCTHTGRRKYCKPSDETWFRSFSKPLHGVWVDKVCELENPMFPTYYRITEQDIEGLRAGKVLTIISPSPFFIAMIQEEADDE